MKTRIIAGATVVCLAIAGLLAASPYLTLRNIAKAIEEKDADRVSRYVDFPALRENVKGQVLVRLQEQIQTPDMKESPIAGLGQALAMSVVNQATDALVSPTGVMLMLKNGKPGKPADVAVAGVGIDTQGDVPRKEFAVDYQGWSKIFVHPKGESGGFIFKRDGLTGWKLIAVKMD